MPPSSARLLSVLLVCGLLPLSVRAEVQDAGAGGFTIEQTAILPVRRAAAWAAVVADVVQWWSDDHTVSGFASNLYINPVPMGCFCERLGEDAGLVHLMVTFANPGVMLRLTGGLGPLGLMGVNGNMTIEFEDLPGAPEATGVTLRYAVGGYRAEGLEELAEPVDALLGEQLQRLTDYVSAP